MAVIRVLAKTHIGDDIKIGDLVFESACRFLNNSVFGISAGCQGIFLVGYSKKHYRRDTQFVRFFRCFNKKCSFVMYKKGKDGKPGGISGFFTNFNKKIPERAYKDIMSMLLKSNGKIFFDDLTKKQGGTFSAYVKIEKNREYGKWQLSLSFPKKNTKINDAIKSETILSHSIAQEELEDSNDNIEYSNIDTYKGDLQKFLSQEISTTTVNISLALITKYTPAVTMVAA